MLRTRVIPCLLLRNGGLVKTVRFKHPRYVGDPINAVKIFNDKEVDELVLLDILATRSGNGPPFDDLARIAREAFMPMGYGGGIRNPDDAKRLFGLGFEKVVLNSLALERPDVVSEIAAASGSQSVVASIDVKRSLFGRPRVHSHAGLRVPERDLCAYAVLLEKAGAGEILLNAVDRDGTFAGYDLPLIRSVAEAVGIPVIAAGGAGKVEDFGAAVRTGGAAAVAAGSLFVFHGRHRAVLITYPSPLELQRVFG
jgi:cyclase